MKLYKDELIKIFTFILFTNYILIHTQVVVIQNICSYQYICLHISKILNGIPPYIHIRKSSCNAMGVVNGCRVCRAVPSLAFFHFVISCLVSRVVDLVGVFLSQSSSDINNAQFLFRFLSSFLRLTKLAELCSLVNLIVCVFSSKVAECSLNFRVDGQMGFQLLSVPAHVKAWVVGLDGHLEDFVAFHGGSFPFW